MFDRVLNTRLKLDIREQIKSFLKALLDWSVVNKYFSTVGWDRFRWSRSEVSCQKVVLNFFSGKFIGKQLRGSLFLLNLQAFSLKETPERTFSCRFLQFLKEHVYLKNHSEWLLLYIQYRLIAIKIQIVFKLNWISRKCVFFRLLFFPFFFCCCCFCI